MAAAPAVTFTQGGTAITSLTVPAGGTADVTVTIVPPAAYPAQTIWGGYVRFLQAGATKLRVPYAAFTGDYQSIVAVGNGGCSLPMLAKIGTPKEDKITCAEGVAPIDGLIGQPAGGTWTQPKKDPVVLLYHLDHQVALETVTLIDAATGQPATQGNRKAIL